ncbi:MAG: efflux RND transporter periplasmic adaptor subunit [Phormidesmis sp.]
MTFPESSTAASKGSVLSKPLLVGIVVLLAAGIGLTAFLRSRAEQQRIAEEEAARPLPVQVNVAALGRVEPAGGVIEVASPEQGGVISELLVSAGDAVTGGQILAYLNLYEVRLAERDLAESQLVEAQQQLVAQQQLGSAQIAEANTRVDQVNLPQAEAIEAQNAQIRDLQAQLNLESIDLNRFERLAAQGAISQQQLDSQRAQVAQTQQKIAAAKATLTQLDTARNANLDNAVAQVSAAEADLLLSQANVGVRSAEHNLALAEARLAQTIIRAPISGQVIELFVELGESVENRSILSVGNTQEMQVVAEVFETDVGLVEPGQSATIRSRNGAFDEVLTGTVDEVALQIFKNDVLDDDPAANADARVVEVDIVVDQAEVIDALTNLQVDVVIDIEESVAAPDSQSDLVRDSRFVEV